MHMEEEHEEEERRAGSAEARGDAACGSSARNLSVCAVQPAATQCIMPLERQVASATAEWPYMPHAWQFARPQQSTDACPWYVAVYCTHSLTLGRWGACSLPWRCAGHSDFVLVTLLLLHRRQDQRPRCCDRPEPSVRGSSVVEQLEVAAAGG